MHDSGHTHPSATTPWPGPTDLDHFELTEDFPTDATTLFQGWLDPAIHNPWSSAEEAKIDPKVGGAYEVGSGYIWGLNLELIPGKRIVQSWKTSDFSEADGHSRLELILTDLPPGPNGVRRARMLLRHSGIPPGQGPDYEDGWRLYYFKPMHDWFRARASR